MACLTLLLLPLLLTLNEARIHRLSLSNETRSVVHLNTFGYFANGTLEVNLTSLYLPQISKTNFTTNPVGFSLARSHVNGVLSYTAEDPEKCSLLKTKSDDTLILFIIDPLTLSVQVKSFHEEDIILTADQKKEVKETRKKRDNKSKLASGNTDTTAGENKDSTTKAEEKPVEDKTAKNKDPAVSDPKESKDTKKQQDPKKQKEQKEEKKEELKESIVTESLTKKGKNINGMKLTLLKFKDSYNFTFHITMGAEDQGLYTLNFHNCYSMMPGTFSPYSLSVHITEKNPAGFLSAAEIPLPRLYICMAAMFLTAAIVWTYTLLKHRYSVFKIHWLMASLAYTKAVSLVFHSINYHFINTEGHPIEGWAVMYYITHLLKGALLFITLALIGTGFAFVKYILSDKEKKIFMIVIPLQVLANVAYIIIEETEEASSEYALWREILFLVDLICCGAILFPVVWSIRHLQEASTTDGKAAMNLEKLKLFRHYYVMIVCYIYFTRIIAILLKVTVPFQWQWSQEFLIEVSTLVFFVLTGFKFRPASNNPYLQLPQDEEDLEMDEVVTESGALEGISKVKKTSNGRERQRDPAL
ncbi:protein GPR108 [Colossoma macropomum]|uniref:protein GPR108 n=1 Tax=Colossoma macropomum TaxID=42526 RepID=UPI0018651660|nr:protein GPR108 [Colossoma macropomum]